MSYYNSYLLDELHRLFPAILYDHTQFQQNDLVQYIRRRMREAYNLYDAATLSYANGANTTQRESDQSSTSSSFQVPPITHGRRHRRRRNAIYSQWYNGSNQSLNHMNTPVSEPVRNTPSPRTSPRTSSHTSPETSPHQDSTNETLTAILGLLSLPSGGGPISVEPLLNPRVQYGYYAPARQHVGLSNLSQDQSWAEILASFMNPIPVRPTQEQIERGTRLFMTDANSTRDSCVICFDAITDGQMQRQVRACDHTFHRECIDRHFQTSPRCPLCRHDIRESVSVSVPVPVQSDGPTNVS